MNEMFSRNIGLLTQEEQDEVEKAVIGIAGAGADGGLTAERIVRLGVKKIKLADPESFDLSNINRQYASSTSAVGLNKAEAVAAELKKIRPELEIEVYNKGINEENVNQFCDGCTLILDEIEYTRPKVSLLLHQQARNLGIEVFSGLNLGYGINVYRFTPQSMRMEEMIGINLDSKDEDFDMQSMVPNIPKYVEKEVVEKVLRGESYIPAVSPAVGFLAGYVSFVILGAIIKKWEIPATPNYTHIDMFEKKFVEINIQNKS